MKKKIIIGTIGIIAIITTVSVVIGYFWIEKKSKICCEENEKCLDYK